MIITKINCFLRCQNGDFLTSLFTCASVTRDDSGFARSDPLASLTYIKGLWALLLASYADEIIHTVWCFSLSCVCVFSSIKKKMYLSNLVLEFGFRRQFWGAKKNKCCCGDNLYVTFVLKSSVTIPFCAYLQPLNFYLLFSLLKISGPIGNLIFQR